MSSHMATHTLPQQNRICKCVAPQAEAHGAGNKEERDTTDPNGAP